jgi:hypothetical protein
MSQLVLLFSARRLLIKDVLSKSSSSFSTKVDQDYAGLADGDEFAFAASVALQAYLKIVISRKLIWISVSYFGEKISVRPRLIECDQ